MVKKVKSESMAFEVVVVLAIVFMVSVTGLVLTSYKDKGTGSISTGTGDGLTGFVVAGPEEETAPSFLDVGVSDITIDPENPLIGETFTITVEIANEGQTETVTPFYITVELSQPSMPLEPLVLQGVMPKSLKPGEKISIPFKISAIVVEGPMRVLASADSTAKLLDENPSNNQRTKTFIIAE